MSRIINFYGGYASFFNPNSIAGLNLWLDATDLSTITKDGSDFVSGWNDKSDIAELLTQAIASQQPQYFSSGFGTKNKPYILGLAGDVLAGYSFNNGTGSSWTAFQVAKISTGTNSQIITSSNSSSPTFPFRLAGTTVTGITGGYKQTYSGGGDNNDSLYSTMSDSGTFTHRHNAVDIAGSFSPKNRTNTWKQIFNSAQGGNGEVAEVLLYNRALTPVEVNNVEAYLNNKYGIY